MGNYLMNTLDTIVGGKAIISQSLREENAQGRPIIKSLQGVIEELGNYNQLALEKYMPVGMILTSAQADFDPNVSYGGTWIQVGQGRTILSCGSKYPVETTGGEYYHVLTINEMPSHNHYFGGDTGAVGASGSKTWDVGYNDENGSDCTSYSGGNLPHNNIQPYSVVTFWKRVS